MPRIGLAFGIVAGLLLAGDDHLADGVGLAIDRPLHWRTWGAHWRLLIIAMPLCIAGVALLGWWAMGLILVAAVLLGAVLAPRTQSCRPAMRWLNDRREARRHRAVPKRPVDQSQMGTTGLTEVDRLMKNAVVTPEEMGVYTRLPASILCRHHIQGDLLQTNNTHSADEVRTDEARDHGRHDDGQDVRDGRRHEDRRAAGAAAPVDRARGGFSLWSVLSGVLVAFGAFVVISAIVSSILAATGIAEGGINANEATNAGIAAAVGLVIAQFLAYLWGGYTSGRMARGSGVLNGILVPIVAIVLVVILGAIVTAMVDGVQGPSAQQLPLPLSTVRDIGTAVGIGLLVAMLLGGALGGLLGARWHTKLENVEAADHRNTV